MVTHPEVEGEVELGCLHLVVLVDQEELGVWAFHRGQEEEVVGVVCWFVGAWEGGWAPVVADCYEMETYLTYYPGGGEGALVYDWAAERSPSDLVATGTDDHAGPSDLESSSSWVAAVVVLEACDFDTYFEAAEGPEQDGQDGG